MAILGMAMSVVDGGTTSGQVALAASNAGEEVQWYVELQLSVEATWLLSLGNMQCYSLSHQVCSRDSENADLMIDSFSFVICSSPVPRD